MHGQLKRFIVNEIAIAKLVTLLTGAFILVAVILVPIAYFGYGYNVPSFIEISGLLIGGWIGFFGLFSFVNLVTRITSMLFRKPKSKP